MTTEKGGRPPLFDNPQDLQIKIDDYFKNCPDSRKLYFEGKLVAEVPCPTVSGLAYYLGFESRQSFYDYKEDIRFSYIMKRARLFIEKEYEILLQTGNVTGIIFALKNMGWKDKQEIESKNENTNYSLENIPTEKLEQIKNIMTDNTEREK